MKPPLAVPLFRVARAAALVAIVSSLCAQTVWNGGGADDNWSTGANWQGGSAPAASTAVQFAGATRLTPNLDSNRTVTTLDFASGAGAFTLGGASTLTITGGITNNSGSLQTVANPVTLSGNQTWSGSSDLTLTGTFTGGSTVLTKSGTGTLTLPALSGTSFSLTLGGGTIVTNGSYGGFGSTSLTMNSSSTGTLRANGNLTLGGSIAMLLSSNLTIDTNGYAISVGVNPGNESITGVPAPTTLTKTGAGTLTLSGKLGSTSPIGIVTINQGELAASTVSSSSSNIGITSATLSTSSGLNGAITLNSGGTLKANGAYTASSGSIAFAASDATFDTNGNNITISMTRSGSGTLNKTGSGTLTLGGTSTQTGGTAVTAGTVAIDSDSRLGTAPGSATADMITLNGGTLESTATFTLNANRGVTLGASGGTVQVDSGTTLTYGGIAAGSGALTKTGTGTLALSGANTYSGATTVSAGTLQLGAGNVIADSSAVSVASGATLSVNGQTDTIGSLAGAGNVSVGAGALSVGAANTSTTFSGVVSGNGSFTKTGTGVLTLSGTNTFSGVTTITAGELKLTGSAASSAFTLNGGLLSGNGTIGGLTIGGGTVSPGNSPGTLTDSGNATFASGGAFLFELNDRLGVAGQDPGWDLLSISGALAITASSGSPFTINLSTLTLSNLAGVPANFSNTGNYTFSFVTAGSISGFDASVFALNTSGVDSSLTGAWSIAQSGNALNLVYSGSAIPEPSIYAALLGAAALGLASWRRVRRRTLIGPAAAR